MTEMLIKSADDVQHQNGAQMAEDTGMHVVGSIGVWISRNVTEGSCSNWQHRSAMTDAAFY